MHTGSAQTCSASIYLATRAPVLIAPAMNGKMYEHSATMQNHKVLSDRGVTFIEPVTGELACGYEGVGKLAPISDILSAVILSYLSSILGIKKALPVKEGSIKIKDFRPPLMQRWVIPVG